MEKASVSSCKPQWITHIAAFLLTLVIAFQTVVPANAYTLVYIQCSIDIATWEIITAAVRDEIGVTSTSNEIRRVEQSALNTMHNNQRTAGGSNLSLIQGLASDVASREKSIASSSGLLAGIAGVAQNIGVGEEKNRVLSFPTNQTRRDSSNSTDFNNALEVVNAISFDLNQAFSVYCDNNGITKTADATAFFNAMVSFLSSVQGFMSSDGTMTYEGMTFTWYAEKGAGSGEYVNWYMLVYEAFNNYALEGDEAVTSDNVYTSNPNQLTKAVVGLFSNMLDGLRGILGLWSMDELLFNTGWRQNGYVGGIFPSSWEPYIWSLFTFMEIFAAMILLYGILNNVVKKAMSTINTIARLHFMSQLQDLFVCAIALALLPIILRVVITLCSSFTSIVYTLVPIDASTGEKRTIADSVARYMSGSGSIGGIIAQFMFFGVQVSFNFLYAMRALSTAILIIIAPVMIAMISVSSSRKQATIQWAKELLAQICIQPIHAFCMTVILLLPTSSHGFDNIIALYALLPFTSVLKGFFFGSAGSWAEQASQKASSRLTGTLAAGGIAAAGAVAGGAAIAFGGGGGNDSDDKDDKSGNSEPDTSSPTDNQSLNRSGASGPSGNNTAPSSNALGDRVNKLKGATARYMTNPSFASGLSLVGAAGGTLLSAGGQAAATLGNAVSQSKLGGAMRNVGNAIKQSNTVQAARENMNDFSQSGPLSSRLQRAANLFGGVGKDAKNLMGNAVGAGKTALVAGAGMALAGVGGIMGGAGGRQLINIGSGMTGSTFSAAAASARNAFSEKSDESTTPDPDLSRQRSGNAPEVPEAVSDPDTFADEYAQMQADGSSENYAFERGLGEWIPDGKGPDGTSEYEFSKDELPSMGVSSMKYDKENRATSVQFGFDKMNAVDTANAKQMLSMWQNGTPAEKDFMKKSGINSVSPIVKTVNGERQVTGMRMSLDSRTYGKNYGVKFDTSRAAAEDGRSLSITTTTKNAPQMIPNVSQHMESAAQANPSSAIATDVSPLRSAMTGRTPPAPEPILEPPISEPPIPAPTPEVQHYSNTPNYEEYSSIQNMTDRSKADMPDNMREAVLEPYDSYEPSQPTYNTEVYGGTPPVPADMHNDVHADVRDAYLSSLDEINESSAAPTPTAPTSAHTPTVADEPVSTSESAPAPKPTTRRSKININDLLGMDEYKGYKN